MNNVAAIKWALAKIKEQGAGVTLAQLDQRLASESLSEVDRQDCREWLDGVLSKQGPQYRALEALVLKLTTIGSAIAERLNQTAIERLTAEEISRLRFWLHTCTLDHPAALPTYRKAGFVQYKEEKIHREL